MHEAKILADFGYSLRRNVRDTMGRKWAYRTSPITGGGSVN